MTSGGISFNNFPENHVCRGIVAQAALAQEVAGQRPVFFNIRAWTPSMTVTPHFKRRENTGLSNFIALQCLIT